MAQAVSFGQITITDLTDVGTLSVYPTADKPLSVIYNPDQNNYTPNWGNTNLTLTPVIYYGGRRLYVGTATGLTVTWTRQEGAAAATALTTGETVSGGVLTVSANKFTTNSTTITYIVSVNYIEPDSNLPLTAEGRITFSLVKQASSVKTCTITGDTIFKYDTDQKITGASSIELTGTVNNASISQWQYANASGAWVKYPSSTTSPTLTVNATDSTFFNNKCIIRLTTSDSAVYDIHTITKLYDGAAGTSTVAMTLTNEDQMIPCDSEGNPPDPIEGVSTEVMIYRGGKNETTSWTIAITDTGGVTYTKGTGNRSVTVTGMTANVATITFTATKTGEVQLVKEFSLIKMKTGADGISPTIYNLELSSYATNRNEAGSFSPSTVTISAYSKTGTNAREPYSGRFQMYVGGAAAGVSPIYTSSSNESSHTITSANMMECLNSGYMEVYLYEAGGTTKKLDTQSLVITNDGKTGSPALNVILGNQTDVIPCNANNKTATQMTITIPFTGYKGTEMVDCTLSTAVPKLFGVSGTLTPATASASGSIVYSIPAGTSVSSSSGILSLTFTIDTNKTVPMEYRWTRSTAAKNGENAVILQLYSPGTVINKDVSSITINASLVNGSSDATSSVSSWRWDKYDGSYTQITGATTSSLVIGDGGAITKDDIDGFVSIRCTATYNSKDYVQYISIIDSTDPLHVVVMSSIGDQIINGTGAGVFYVLVFQGEDEVDALKSDRFLTSPPANPATNDFYYHIDETNKTVTLKRYNGSAWKSRSEDASSERSKFDYAGTYTWSHMNRDGSENTNEKLLKTGKVIYIDGSLFTKKMVSTVKVEI